MPIQKRHSTNCIGVHYIEGTSLDGKRSEKIYLIRYRKEGKAVEEKAGRQLAAFRARLPAVCDIFHMPPRRAEGECLHWVLRARIRNNPH